MANNNKEKLNDLFAIKQAKHWSCRLILLGQIIPTEWSRFLIHPSPSYFEIEIGIVPVKDIEYIDISIFETQVIGRLIPPKQINITAEIKCELNTIDITYFSGDTYIRIPLI